MEIWIEVKGYEGLYEVSNLARIKSLKKKKWNGFDYQEVQEKIMSPKTNRKGYKQLCFTVKSKSKTVSLHRIVAQAFIDNPDNLPIVLHIDDNPSNCLPENLKWGTQRDNMIDSAMKGRKPRGETSTKSKLTEIQVREIRKRLEDENISCYKVAKYFKVSQNCIWNIKRRNSWKHI